LIKYEAKDSMTIDFKGNLIHLYGSAKVNYEKIELTADFITLDWNKNLVIAEGMPDSTGEIKGLPVFSDQGKPYKAQKIMYNFKSQKGRIYELRTEEGGGFIQGKDVMKQEDNSLLVRHAQFSTCDHEHQHFYIAATKLKIMENQIITGPAYLVVEDVPLPLAVPFGFFPKKNERSSGILLPSPGEETSRGFFLKGLGYYFGFSDYFDLAIKGDIFSRGSWAVNASSNYNLRYKFNGNLSILYANNRFGDPDASDFTKSTDFMINWTHNQDPKARPNSSFKASVNAGSQNSYRYNSTNPNEMLQNTLRSSISYTKRFAGTPFSLNSSITHSQNLSNQTVNLTAPDVSVSMKRITPFKPKKGVMKKRWYNDIGFNYSMKFRNSINTYDTLLLLPETWKTWENGMQHSIPFSTTFKIFKYFQVSPSINYTGYTFFQKVEKNFVEVSDTNGWDYVDEVISNGVFHQHDFNVKAQVSTRIYGMYNINRMGLIAVRHLVSPTISFSYRPDFSDPKYGYYKSVQVDSTGKTQMYSVINSTVIGRPGTTQSGNITYSIQNNLEAKIKSKKDSTEEIKKIKLIDNFNISGYYNFLADSLQLSTIRLNGRTTLFQNKVNIQFTGILDPYFLTDDSLTINKFELIENKRLGRLTQANLTISANLNSQAMSSKGRQQQQQEYIGHNGMPLDMYVDFSVPWNLSLNYTLAYSKPYFEPDITQTLSVNGGLNLTQKWKVTFRTGYDVEEKELTYTSVDIHRDLHCWEMSFSWIPFGLRQSYMFTLKVKSPVLKDLKIKKDKSFYDNLYN
jgi:lipopolysaccharide assembly outer membrane protein LptD (OstA)